MTMDFDFSAEQYALRDLAHDLFEKEFPPARLRELWHGGERDARVWKMLAEVGILGLAIPEAYGGSGGTVLDFVLVLEEAGAAALPEPLVETAAVAAPVIAQFGNEALRDEWLPRIASGEAIVTVQTDGSPYVADADVADLLLVQRGADLHAIPRGSVVTEPVRSMDLGRRIFTVAPDLSDATLVARDDAAAVRTASRGATATAAVLNGVGMRLVEMTRTYVAARRQFGKPVGSFQAVQHKLADMHIAVESSRPAAWYAAYADATGLPDATRAAQVAKACASEASALVNREALQCHAGIGFTWEHDLHLWLKRGKALEQSFGTAAEHRARLAAILFGHDA